MSVTAEGFNNNTYLLPGKCSPEASLVPWLKKASKRQ